MCPINKNDQKFLRQKLASVSHFVLVNSGKSSPTPTSLSLKKKGGGGARGRKATAVFIFLAIFPEEISPVLWQRRVWTLKLEKKLFQPLDMTTEEKPPQWWQKHQTVPVFMHS